MTDPACRRWLMRASISTGPTETTLLHRVCEQLREPAPAAGLAALRYRGQTGRPADGWLAGADPVWLQAGLDKLYVHATSPEDIDQPSLHALYEDLQQTLFGAGEIRLDAIGSCGYLRTAAPFATSTMPAEAIDGKRPDAWLPVGKEAARYLQINGEIQLALHDHPDKPQREQRGQRPVNGIWLWGGGEAGDDCARHLPMLYANDPLLRGYWLCSESLSGDWPGSFAVCVAANGCDFVAAIPPPACGDGMESVFGALRELQSLQGERRLQDITLLFHDGRIVRVRRRDRYRFWRRSKVRLNEKKP